MAAGGGSAMQWPNPPSILLATMSGEQKIGPLAGPKQLVHGPPRFSQKSSVAIRQGGRLFSLRFGLPQLEEGPANPLVHLVAHSGTLSTSINPVAGSVLPGSTVTFSWGYTGGGASNATNVPYRYTGKEQDDSTGLYYYEARYYDPVLGRFISADTLVPDPSNPQTLNRYAYALNNPLRYTDPSGNFACGGVCIGIAVGAALGALQSGLASDWDLEATLTGAAIGGAAGAVGGAVGSYVGGVVGSKLTGVVGPVLAKAGGLAAGGIAGGAVGGLTSGVLSRAAGYDTDIGLTVAAGAAGGLAGGIVGAGGIQILGPDPAGVAIAMIAGSAAGGALSSTISGSDPGMGALFAAGGMALAIGARYIYQESQNHGNIQVQKLKKIASDLNQDLGKSGGRAILISLKGDNASCVSGNCLGISGKLTPIGPSGNTIDRYILTITAGNKTATGQIWQIRKIPVAGQFGTIVKDIPIQHYGEFSVLAGGEPFTINLGRPNFNGYIQLDISGTSNAANPAFNGVGRFEFKGYCSTFVNC